MEREGDHYRASTYLEFRRRYESKDSGEGEWLAPARDAIQNLGEKATNDLLEKLTTVARRLSRETGIPSGLGGEDKVPSA